MGSSVRFYRVLEPITVLRYSFFRYVGVVMSQPLIVCI